MAPHFGGSSRAMNDSHEESDNSESNVDVKRLLGISVLQRRKVGGGGNNGGGAGGNNNLTGARRIIPPFRKQPLQSRGSKNKNIGSPSQNPSQNVSALSLSTEGSLEVSDTSSSTKSEKSEPQNDRGGLLPASSASTMSSTSSPASQRMSPVSAFSPIRTPTPSVKDGDTGTLTQQKRLSTHQPEQPPKPANNAVSLVPLSPQRTSSATAAPSLSSSSASIASSFSPINSLEASPRSRSLDTPPSTRQGPPEKRVVNPSSPRTFARKRKDWTPVIGLPLQGSDGKRAVLDEEVEEAPDSGTRRRDASPGAKVSPEETVNPSSATAKLPRGERETPLPQIPPTPPNKKPVLEANNKSPDSVAATGKFAAPKPSLLRSKETSRSSVLMGSETTVSSLTLPRTEETQKNFLRRLYTISQQHVGTSQLEDVEENEDGDDEDNNDEEGPDIVKQNDIDKDNKDTKDVKKTNKLPDPKDKSDAAGIMESDLQRAMVVKKEPSVKEGDSKAIPSPKEFLAAVVAAVVEDRTGVEIVHKNGVEEIQPLKEDERTVSNFTFSDMRSALAHQGQRNLKSSPRRRHDILKRSATADDEKSVNTFGSSSLFDQQSTDSLSFFSFVRRQLTVCTGGGEISPDDDNELFLDDQSHASGGHSEASSTVLFQPANGDGREHNARPSGSPPKIWTENILSEATGSMTETPLQQRRRSSVGVSQDNSKLATWAADNLGPPSPPKPALTLYAPQMLIAAASAAVRCQVPMVTPTFDDERHGTNRMGEDDLRSLLDDDDDDGQDIDDDNIETADEEDYNAEQDSVGLRSLDQLFTDVEGQTPEQVEEHLRRGIAAAMASRRQRQSEDEADDADQRSVGTTQSDHSTLYSESTRSSRTGDSASSRSSRSTYQSGGSSSAGSTSYQDSVSATSVDLALSKLCRYAAERQIPVLELMNELEMTASRDDRDCVEKITEKSQGSGIASAAHARSDGGGGTSATSFSPIATVPEGSQEQSLKSFSISTITTSKSGPKKKGTTNLRAAIMAVLDGHSPDRNKSSKASA